jgi:uncharacterized protein (TIGR03089 family)
VSLTDRLLGPILRDDAARPLITFYDDADGSRVELSGATVANWAAKTANWLRDECDLAVGDAVHVALPAHWQTAAALLGAWWCGAHVVDKPAGAAVSLVAPDAVSSVPSAGGGAPVRAVVALDPLGRGLADPPDGVLDWVSEIRVHGDLFQPLDPVPPGTPALLGASVATVHARAVERAAALGIPPGARVLSTMDWTLPDGLTDGLLSVLAAPASLVHCANPDPDAMAARLDMEHVTIRLGT